MDQEVKVQKKTESLPGGFFGPLLPLFKSRYFYIGIISILTGIAVNNASQSYLHNYLIEGKTLPILSDLILDNLPVIDVSVIYDLVALIPIILTVVYWFHKKDYKRIPLFFLLIGIFYIVRGIFIVLTPFGNPPMFNGSDPPFHGFANFELGVYPSGHTGSVCLLMLLVRDSTYKWLIGTCLVIVITALFLAHSHYSIDVLSGIFFAYAIKAFGEKHFRNFDLNRYPA